jgi:predicted aminopeptidase
MCPSGATVVSMNYKLEGEPVSLTFHSFHSANQKQELPVVAMFLNGSDEMSNLYIRPSIDASVHLAKVFQRRRLKYEKLTDDRRQVMTKAHIAFGKVN